MRTRPYGRRDFYLGPHGSATAEEGSCSGESFVRFVVDEQLTVWYS